jgi:hypothetical protein
MTRSQVFEVVLMVGGTMLSLVGLTVAVVGSFSMGGSAVWILAGGPLVPFGIAMVVSGARRLRRMHA